MSRRRVRRGVIGVLALACGTASLWGLAGGSSSKVRSAAVARVPHNEPAMVAEGRRLFEVGCSTCHGYDARGVPRRGPSLRGVGAMKADFYLRTGRMPLDAPGNEPERGEPAYPPDQIHALVAFIASFGGPGIPSVDPARGVLSDGMQAFADRCAGCHQILAQGGIVTRARVPDLQASTPRDVAEAIRMGPYLMPVFSDKQVDQHTLDSIARYVEYTKDPRDDGGWGIGHLGPIPEGMVTWLLGLAALVLAIRLIGERTTE